MIRDTFLTAIFLLLFTFASSQLLTTKTSVVTFQSSARVGISAGQKGSTPALNFSVVNGVQFKQWFAGVGAGVDYYGLKRSVPLFLSVQRMFSEKTNTFFLFTGAGYNLPWLKASEKMQNVDNYKQAGGLFYEAGVGYKFKFISHSKMGLSAGYSFRQLKEKYTEQCAWCEQEIPPSEVDNYKFRVIEIKLNWWFL